MEDFSQLLSQRVDTISQQWVEAVIKDKQIKTTDKLSRPAVQDHIPYLLEALISVLSQNEASDVKKIVENSLEHGATRAEQGFDPTEVVREYHLLRSCIVANLEAELLESQASEVLRAVSLINTVVDEAIAQCFKSYIKHRLHELEDLQHQLNLNVQELQRLVRTSQENMNMLAHELKTPLNSIIGYSELFLRQQRSEQLKTTKPVEHIERVLRNGRQLLHLINDALELSRYETGNMQLHLAPTNVSAVTNTVIEIIEPLASAKGLELKVNCDNAPKQVVTDPLRLQQIIINLVSNAIRYTEAGYVTVECYSLPDFNWSLSVKDTGIGIRIEDQAHIFEPFGRAQHPGKQHPPDSTGLGLAIVARLVKLLQGEISLTSAPGMGTTFSVTLPLEVKTV
ncbi:histidine kinase [Calothrix sp. NIES-4071]|nr:histidine kinase [Calothrix sp. NIES-4071]BAZ61354.1 histidine kinase [Calothrix sp. NIES-4105]